MKPAREMTLGEIEQLIHVHDFSSDTERDNAFWFCLELAKIVDFIEERIKAVPSLPCKCPHCEEIRNRKPKRAPAVKEKKTEHITFSLD